LLDTHENTRLLFYKHLCSVINIPIAENTEYIIYRAKLAAYETIRLNVDLKNLEKALIFIEDREFYRHSGISYKSLARAVLGQIGVKRRSGGSTIIQQLVRTLFIRDLSKTIRRKFIELGMAPWIDSILSKKDILAIYLSSVRFERGKFGVVAAMNHYFGTLANKPSKAQAFFLIERISNVQSKLLINKIIETAKSAVKYGVLTECDLVELCDLYSDAVSRGKIFSCKEDLFKLSNGLID
jgi:penicillin-binding protein 1A